MNYEDALDLVYKKITNEKLSLRQAFDSLKLEYAFSNFRKRILAKYPELKVTSAQVAAQVRMKILCDNLSIKDAHIALGSKYSYQTIRTQLFKLYPELKYQIKERREFGIRFQDSLLSKCPSNYKSISKSQWLTKFCPSNSLDKLKYIGFGDDSLDKHAGCYIWTHTISNNKHYLVAGFGSSPAGYIVSKVKHGFDPLRFELSKDLVLKIKNLNLQS